MTLKELNMVRKKQDMKQRRADSENMEKADGKRKFSGDKSMDEVEEGIWKKVRRR